MLHYNLHYKLFAPTPARGENGPELLGAGGSDPDKLFGRIDCQKVGALPPVLSLSCAVTFTMAGR